MRRESNKYFAGLFVLLLLCMGLSGMGFAQDRPVAVLISKEIRPFIEMVTGLEKSLDFPVVRVFLDERNTPFSHDALYKGLELNSYAYVIAVGPSALSYLCTLSPSQDMHNVLYAMVLNPEKIIPPGIDLCGISLNLFSGVQISRIPKVFPKVKRIGVFFDPDNNKEWFTTAGILGKFKGIELVPLHVKVQSDINRHYRDGYMGVDALLFIPDKTVISPTIIKHVIKQAVIRKIPVIGYNQFFYQAGAAMSFVLDYRAIGGQMAHMVTSLLKGDACAFTSPAYNELINHKMIEILDLDVNLIK